MPDELTQQTAGQSVETTYSDDVENAALTIYDSLDKEGFDAEKKIAIYKAVGGLIRSDVDEKLKYFTRLKSSI